MSFYISIKRKAWDIGFTLDTLICPYRNEALLSIGIFYLRIFKKLFWNCNDIFKKHKNESKEENDDNHMIVIDCYLFYELCFLFFSFFMPNLNEFK